MDEVDKLIQDLKSEDADVRREATVQLGHIGGPQAVPALIEALGDENGDVRKSAAEALGKIVDISDVPTVIETFRSGNTHIIHEAIGVLCKIGEPALPALKKAVGGDDAEVRNYVALVLGKVGDVSAVPALIETFRGGDNYIIASASDAICKIGKPALPALLKAIGDEDENVRINVALTLGNIGDSSAVPALIEALGDRDACMRINSVEALEKIGDALLQSRASRQSENFLEFCQIAVPVLIGALGDEDILVRSTAVGALGNISDPSAVPALIEALGDLDVDVRDTVVGALGEIAENHPEYDWTPAVPALIEALGDEDLFVRSKAAAVLGDIGDITVVPALIEAIGDNEWYVRRNAVWALGNIAGKYPESDWDLTVSAVVKALVDEQRHVRNSAAEALGNMINIFKTNQALRSYGDFLKSGFADLTKKERDTNRLIELKMKFAGLMKEVAKRRNELASKRDTLLDDKPKSPKRGGMYRRLNTRDG